MAEEHAPLLSGSGGGRGRTNVTSYEDVTYALTQKEPNSAPTEGAPLGTAINLAATAFGASMLSLPLTLSAEGAGGPFFGTLFLILLAFGAIFSARVFVNGAIRHGEVEYGDVVGKALGKTLGTIAGVAVNICLLVAAMSYIVGIVDNAPDLLPFATDAPRWLILSVVMILTTPATLVGTLAPFAAFSAIACTGCMILAGSIVLRAVQALVEGQEGPVDAATDMGKIFHFNFPGLFAVAAALQTFVYAFHYVLPDCLSELKSPSPKRVSLTINLTTIILAVPYIPFAIFGWILCGGANIPDNVLKAFPKNDFVVSLAKWVITSVLFLTYQLFLIPLRRKVESKLFKVITPGLSKTRIFSALIWQSTVFLLSLILKNLGIANAVAGGCIGLVMFTFPGLLLIEEITGTKSKYTNRAESGYGSQNYGTDGTGSRFPRAEFRGEGGSSRPADDEADLEHESAGLLGTVRRAKSLGTAEIAWVSLGVVMAVYGAVVAIFGIASAF